jgi:hypothetical protein
MMTTRNASALTPFAPGQRVWTHWHGDSSVHDTAAIVLRAGDPAPDGGVVLNVPGKIVVREVGYGSLPHDVFALDPAEIRPRADCDRCSAHESTEGEQER